MTISRLWYVTTSVHLWRFYFRYQKVDRTKLSEPSRLNWEACDRAISKFTDQEIDLLEQYYMVGYGNYEDMDAVRAYAEQNGIKPSDAWDTIKRANYEVIVERGLMERKGGDKDGT